MLTLAAVFLCVSIPIARTGGFLLRCRQGAVYRLVHSYHESHSDLCELRWADGGSSHSFCRLRWMYDVVCQTVALYLHVILPIYGQLSHQDFGHWVTRVVTMVIQYTI